MPHKILIVDDDEGVRRTLERFLTSRSFSVVATDNGSEALVLAQESRPDLILADAEMPGLDGHALCRVLKKGGSTRSTPVIMISGAKIQERDILSGFEGGADDYVLKPFSLPVLLARIQAVLRRYQTPFQMKDTLKKSGIELNPSARTVQAGGRPISLNRKEFDLLTALISKPGHLLSVAYLLETVWGYDPADYNDPHTVEVHISQLRRKLGPRLAKRIVNLTGHGYKFED